MPRKQARVINLAHNPIKKTYKHLWHLTFLARKKELLMVQRDSDQGRKGRQVLKTNLVGVQELLVIVRHFDSFLCLQVEGKLVLKLFFVNVGQL